MSAYYALRRHTYCAQLLGRLVAGPQASWVEMACGDPEDLCGDLLRNHAYRIGSGSLYRHASNPQVRQALFLDLLVADYIVKARAELSGDAMQVWLVTLHPELLEGLKP